MQLSAETFVHEISHCAAALPWFAKKERRKAERKDANYRTRKRPAVVRIILGDRTFAVTAGDLRSEGPTYESDVPGPLHRKRS